MHFRTVQSFKTNYAPATISQYESNETGLRVVTVNQKSPKVLGYFVLATEVHDDSGSPHTLEHLCFMGSKNYQYKGVLDKLAARAYSSTNAWTPHDHTAYTLETAGWDGFAQILPVYLEHVLLPTLTDAACLTEVHYVDGTGNDAGVVYSEMQAVQNTQSELMSLRAKRLMYPEGVGYRYEFGGMMQNLRELKAERIRQFHRDMYQPQNLRLIIIGPVEEQSLLTILSNFELAIKDYLPPRQERFARPFLHSTLEPPLEKSIVETVNFPDEDESSGEILISFLGPDCRDLKQWAALEAILLYLAGSQISILDNTLVEKEQLCSSVFYEMDPRIRTTVWFTISGVATEQLKDVEKRFFEVLREAAAGPIDMEYLHDCMHRNLRQIKFRAEGTGDYFSENIIMDHVYGDREGTRLAKLEDLEIFESLFHWWQDEWKKFMTKWLSDAHHISIIGVPSSKLEKEMRETEKARIEERKQKLGPERLKKLGEQLDEAKRENEREIPPQMLSQFAVPDAKSIQFIPTITARSPAAKHLGSSTGTIQAIIDRDASDVPLFIQFEHIPSNFITLKVVFGLGNIPWKLKPLLSLFIENFFSCAVIRNEKVLPFEEAVAALEKDTIHYAFGSGPGSEELMQVALHIEREKYVATIAWLRDLLFHPVFEQERLEATVARMLADIADEKRSGSVILHAVGAMLQYSQDSSRRARTTLVKAVYLKRLKQQLKKEPASIIAKLEELRGIMCTPNNMRILVAADIEKLGRPVSSWQSLIREFDAIGPLQPLSRARDCLSELGKQPGGAAHIVPVAAIDSSYAFFAARGLNDFHDERYAALVVALTYLDATEGPVWEAIRGPGLAYGSNFSRNIDTGLIFFSIYRSPDSFKAFVAGKKVVEDFAHGKREFEKSALEGAISSLILGLADEQPTMRGAAEMSFVNQVVKGLPKDWDQALLEKIQKVTTKDLRAAMELVVPIFQPKQATMVATCATIMADKLKDDFSSLGFDPKIQRVEEFQDDYGITEEFGIDEDMDDDDDEEEEEGDEESGSDASDGEVK